MYYSVFLQLNLKCTIQKKLPDRAKYLKETRYKQNYMDYPSKTIYMYVLIQS